MDIQSLISRYAPALVQQLVAKSDFTQPQAQGFVPGLITKVVGLLQGGRLDVQSLLGGGASAVTSKLDLSALAKDAGIDRAKAEAGAREVVPSLVQKLSSEPGGIEAMLGELGGGAKGMLGKASKLFGG